VNTCHLDELRGISLRPLLIWHGYAPRAEGVSCRVRTERHNLVVTGSRWFDNKTGTGGAGAIDLQMHLTGQDFPTACRVLAEQFPPGTSLRQGIATPSTFERKPDPERKPFHELIALHAVRDDSQWPVARTYLIETRKIEASLVDALHVEGTIYANHHRPNPSLVFLHRNSQGAVSGATLRDTRHESSFRPTLGNKLTAWFSVGDPTTAHVVAAAESPIDALSYYMMKAGRSGDLAVVSCSGSFVPHELLWESYERKQTFIVALNNDRAGGHGWRKAWDETSDWTGFKISSDCPQGKDWNADLVHKAEKQSLAGTLRTPSLRL
jgi:hypothetical protein